MGNLFFNTLVRTNSEIKRDRAARVANGAKRSVDQKVMELEAQKEAVEEAISAAVDLSTSNSRDSINAIDAFEAEGWADKINTNRLQLKILNEKLDVAYALRTEFFEEDAGDVVVSDSEQAED